MSLFNLEQFFAAAHALEDAYAESLQQPIEPAARVRGVPPPRSTLRAAARKVENTILQRSSLAAPLQPQVGGEGARQQRGDGEATSPSFAVPQAAPSCLPTSIAGKM